MLSDNIINNTVYHVYCTLTLSITWLPPGLALFDAVKTDDGTNRRTGGRANASTSNKTIERLSYERGGGPRVVVSTAAFHARGRGPIPGLGGLKQTKNVSSPSTCKTQYCGELPWPRVGVLGLRPTGLEFRILCLEDHLTILRRFSWPSLAYMCTKVALSPIHFISFCHMSKRKNELSDAQKQASKQESHSDFTFRRSYKSNSVSFQLPGKHTYSERHAIF